MFLMPDWGASDARDNTTAGGCEHARLSAELKDVALALDIQESVRGRTRSSSRFRRPCSLVLMKSLN
jgi:hypothetical protein